MALFAAISVARLLTIFTVVMRPAAVMAVEAQRSSAAPTGQGQSALEPGQSPRTDRTAKATGMPKLSKASTPYDMKALRNFDAGSHQ
jgi:hypothetical protein